MFHINIMYIYNTKLTRNAFKGHGIYGLFHFVGSLIEWADDDVWWKLIIQMRFIYYSGMTTECVQIRGIYSQEWLQTAIPIDGNY